MIELTAKIEALRLGKDRYIISTPQHAYELRPQLASWPLFIHYCRRNDYCIIVSSPPSLVFSGSRNEQRISRCIGISKHVALRIPRTAGVVVFCDNATGVISFKQEWLINSDSLLANQTERVRTYLTKCQTCTVLSNKFFITENEPWGIGRDVYQSRRLHLRHH